MDTNIVEQVLDLPSGVCLPDLDACLAGRAKPELNLQVSFANGISGTPAALVTRWGDVIVLDKTVDAEKMITAIRAALRTEQRSRAAV